MNHLFPANSAPNERIQSRLLTLAAVFLFIYSLALTLSPAVRLHSWQVSYRWTHWGGFAIWLLGFMMLHRLVSKRAPDRDPYLIPAAALLSGWGLLTIWRLDEGFGWRQSLWLMISMAAFAGGLRVPNLLGQLKRYRSIWLVGGLLLAALTFVFGIYPGGTGPRLWLGLGGIYLQPSEPLKLLLVIYLAAYLADRLPFSSNLLQFLTPTAALVGGALLILLVQRDLGTATIFLFLYAVLIYLATGRRRVILISGGILLVAGAAGYALFDVIRVRVDAWLNPWVDSAGRSYQIVQSLLAVAAGGVTGRGPGLGSPRLVPVAHSDFIFASIAEEFGLIGMLALLVVIALLLIAGLRTALRAPTNYQRYLAAGISAYFCGQAILIIGGNLRLLPLTGVTLPFVSYGGSSLLTCFVSLLLLVLISAQGEEEPAALRQPLPYRTLGTALLTGLTLLGVIGGYWTYVRNQDLQLRRDNPRRAINDRYVMRGSILDRTNQPIAVTEGQPGDYTRKLLYPELGSIVGYTHPTFGQSGIEASLDAYLRGLSGNPASLLWLDHILYSQTPPGVDVRLSLYLGLQKQADELLGNHIGALVLLNAKTGEILAMASHPTFDPNTLDQNWQEWITDEDAPLLNRATQGKYPVGTALTSFLAARTLAGGTLPPLPESIELNVDGQRLTCAGSLPAEVDWAGVLQHSCPGATALLSRQITPTQLNMLFRQLGLTETPNIQLPVAAADTVPDVVSPVSAALGLENKLTVSPLQMALAAAEISNNGEHPAARLALAVNTPHQGWVILPSDEAQSGLPASAITATARQLQISGQPLWQSVATARQNEQQFTWFLGGTLPEWQGTPVALALLLEEQNPTAAQSIGTTLLQAALNP